MSYIKVSTTKNCHLFLRVEQETHNSSKTRLIFGFQLQFVLKSQQKVDITLSKICQSHQKLRSLHASLKLFTKLLHLKTACTRMLLKRGIGNGEWGTGNGESGMEGKSLYSSPSYELIKWSVSRALHRYRRGYGLESRSGLMFFFRL